MSGVELTEDQVLAMQRYMVALNSGVAASSADAADIAVFRTMCKRYYSKFEKHMSMIIGITLEKYCEYTEEDWKNFKSVLLSTNSVSSDVRRLAESELDSRPADRKLNMMRTDDLNSRGTGRGIGRLYRAFDYGTKLEASDQVFVPLAGHPIMYNLLTKQEGTFVYSKKRRQGDEPEGASQSKKVSPK